MSENGISRRSFIVGAAVTAASVATMGFGLVGCGKKGGGGSTYDNLCAALQTEADDIAKYNAYAEVASAEGYEQVERLCKAVAAGDQVHMGRIFTFASTMNPKCALPEGAAATAGATDANLMAAVVQETNECGVVYPSYITTATEEGYAEVVSLLDRTRKAEGFHAQLFFDCYNNLQRLDGATYYVCPICGFVSKGELDGACPICDTTFNAFQSF